MKRSAIDHSEPSRQAAPCIYCGGAGQLPALEWARWHALWYVAYVNAWNTGLDAPTAFADATAGEPPDGPEQIGCPRCNPEGGADGAITVLDRWEVRTAGTAAD